MKFIHTFSILVVLSCSVSIAHSADKEGNFLLGGGTGGVMCPQFVATMEKARSLGIDSVEFVNATQGYTMYLLGFKTGYNMSTKDTCDIFPNDEKVYSLLSWVENYCRINATNRFGDGVVALSKNHNSKRLRVCPK